MVKKGKVAAREIHIKCFLSTVTLVKLWSRLLAKRVELLSLQILES